jgi:hypothetical protein
LLQWIVGPVLFSLTHFECFLYATLVLTLVQSGNPLKS